jgi:uracil-DNA glycosylase
MKNEINIEELQAKLYEKLKPSGWGDKLKTFIMSDDFISIIKYLVNEVEEGRRFTPTLKQLFRCFEECPYDKLKVVMMAQDPYPQAFVADGIPFSCSNLDKPEASLRYIHKELHDTITMDYKPFNDLKAWSNQGILMLNTALTTTIGKTGVHYALWQPFIAFVLDILTFQNPGLIYVFVGRKAQDWAESIPDNNWKLTCSHPASAGYSNLPNWDSDRVFQKITALTEKHFNQKIIW